MVNILKIFKLFNYLITLEYNKFCSVKKNNKMNALYIDKTTKLKKKKNYDMPIIVAPIYQTNEYFKY